MNPECKDKKREETLILGISNYSLNYINVMVT